MPDITCKKCGLINEYDVIDAGQHKSAYCKGCGSYIKHLPQNNPVDVMPFGLYKNREIKTLIADREIQYLQWLTQSPTIKGSLKKTIDDHLSKL